MGRLAMVTALGQTMLALSLPISARLYGAYAIGVFAGVLVLGQAGAILATGRIEQSLPRIPSEYMWGVVRTLLVGAACLAGPLGVAAVLIGAGRGSWNLWLASTALIFSIAVYGIANMVLLSGSEFGSVAVLRAVNAVVTATLQLAGGLLWPNPSTLLYAYAAGSVIAAGVAIPAAVRARRGRDRATGRVIFREERLLQFGGSVGASALMTSVTLGLPVLGLNHLFGEAVAASFFLARRLLMLPTQLVAQTVNEVSYAVLARSTPDEVSRYVSAWLRRLAGGALLILVVGVCAAPIISFVLGGEYVSVGAVMVLQTFPAAAQLLGSSLANILLVLHAEHVRLAWSAIRLTSLAGALVVVGFIGTGYTMAVAVISIVTVAGLMGLLWSTLRVVDLRRREANGLRT